MNLTLRSALLALLALGSIARAQTVPPRGDETTFDVATWNIEWFGSPSNGPSNDALQRENVAAVIRQADIDLWALQEIVDPRDFEQLVQDLQGDGYTGFLGPTPRFGDQRLAYIYKTDVVSRIVERTLFTEEEGAFAYRLPIEFRTNVAIGGETRSIWFINLHAKCCGDAESYARRVDAATALKEYTDVLEEQGRAVIVLGDFNDRLNQSIAGGLSPYRPFYTDTEDYLIATREFDPGTPTYCSTSTCSSGTPLDHILFTSALFPEYVSGSGERYIELVSAIPNYTTTTSDHLPVVARFALHPTAGEAGPEAGPVALLPAAPSPFRNATDLRFRLDAPGAVRLDVVDVLGRPVATVEGTYGAGEHAVPLDGSALAPGLYLVRLQAGTHVQARTVLRVR